MLPGEPDPAVHLRVQVRVPVRGRHGQRRRHGRGVGELVAAADPARPASQSAAVASSAATSMLAQWCLTAWNMRDRPAELLAHLRVLGRHLRALASHAGRLGGEHGPGEVGQQPARRRQRPRPARRRASPGRPGGPGPDWRAPGPVRRRAGFRPRRHRRRRRPAARRPGDRRSRRRPGRSPPRRRRSPRRRARPRRSARRRPGRAAAGLQLVEPSGGDHRAGDHGRDERPRSDGAAHSSATTSVSGRPKPEPPCSSGRCSPSQPSSASSAPEGRQLVRLGVEQGPGALRATCLVRKSATVWARARCSSVMAIDMQNYFPFIQGGCQLSAAA